VANEQYVWGTGRRKSAVARVRIRPGSGNIVVNEVKLDDYFKGERDRQVVRSPLVETGNADKYDVFANVNGGGTTGQADAVLLGIARALLKTEEGLIEPLRAHGFLTRDSRMKERKKYGRRGARRGFQFSKR